MVKCSNLRLETDIRAMIRLRNFMIGSVGLYIC